MTSNRPLPPAAVPTRAEVWRRRLLGTAPGRVIVAGVAIKAVTALAGAVAPASWSVLDVVDAFGSLLLLLAGGYLLVRGLVLAKRRVLWRVRRKLILSYVFVGLVPGLLIIAFFLIAGFLLFFNMSSYLLQSRVRTLMDQAQFLAQSATLEAEYGETVTLSRRRLDERVAMAAERYPFTSLAIVPMSGLECPNTPAATGAALAAMRIGPWRHLAPPARVPRWVSCDGFTGLLAYEVAGAAGTEYRLVMRAVAVPQARTPQWAVVVDLPLSLAVEARLREETGVRLGDVTVLPFDDPLLTMPVGQILETRPAADDAGTTLEQSWVTLLDVHDWDTGTTADATVAMRLNLLEIYERISTLSTGLRLGQILLLVLAFIGVLFLTIQFVALVIGFVLARQITGAVHDLFMGTEHLRNRDFTYHIPVRARDQLGELAESFNQMTGEITNLIRENAAKARMEQEMLAARQIQQRLLPSGNLKVPGMALSAFCEPAREVAGDYFDFLKISDRQLGVLIADVSGKGLPAGLYMAQLKVLVQSLARTHSSPGDFLRAVNRVMADTIDSASFITMSYGVIDLAKKEMVFSRAGHCPLIHVPGAAPAGLRRAQLIAPDGLVLGLKFDDGQMFDGMIEEVTIPLAPGDLIVFYTDGVSETMNEAFDCYGEGRLTKVLEQYSHLPFEQLRSFLFADLRAFSGGGEQHDDMTMVLLRMDEAAVAGPGGLP